jgi:hypothetical protein
MRVSEAEMVKEAFEDEETRIGAFGLIGYRRRKRKQAA